MTLCWAVLCAFCFTVCRNLNMTWTVFFAKILENTILTNLCKKLQKTHRQKKRKSLTVCRNIVLKLLLRALLWILFIFVGGILFVHVRTFKSNVQRTTWNAKYIYFLMSWNCIWHPCLGSPSTKSKSKLILGNSTGI